MGSEIDPGLVRKDDDLRIGGIRRQGDLQYPFRTTAQAVLKQRALVGQTAI
jgi:hypothetical protein